MKKIFKKAIVVCASTLALGGVAIPTISAETNFDEAFVTSVLEANQSFTSAKVDGTVQVSVTSDNQTADLGKVKFTAGGNTKPLSGSLEGSFESLFLGGANSFYAYLQNSVLYVGYSNRDGETEWDMTDTTAAEKEIEEAIAQGKEVDIAAQSELTHKYFDITEEGTNYVFTLKQNIDADELWADISKVVDVEELKAEAIRQYEANSGEKITDEARKEIDEIYSAESLAKILAFNPTFEVSYDKDSKFLTAINVSLNAKPADFMEESEQSSDSSMPEEVNVMVELKVSEHNKEQTVTVPEEATKPKSDSMDETTTAE